MNKHTIRDLLNWLDAASKEEIESTKKNLMEALDGVSSREVRSDIRLAIRLIDEELLARTELARFGQL